MTKSAPTLDVKMLLYISNAQFTIVTVTLIFRLLLFYYK